MLRHQIIICVPQRKLRFVTIFLFFPFRLSRGVKAVIHAACGKCSLKTSIEEKKRKLPEKRIYVDNFYCHIHNDSGRELHPQLVFHLFTPWACKNNSYSWRQIIKMYCDQKTFHNLNWAQSFSWNTSNSFWKMEGNQQKNLTF